MLPPSPEQPRVRLTLDRTGLCARPPRPAKYAAGSKKLVSVFELSRAWHSPLTVRMTADNGLKVSKRVQISWKGEQRVMAVSFCRSADQAGQPLFKDLALTTLQDWLTMGPEKLQRNPTGQGAHAALSAATLVSVQARVKEIREANLQVRGGEGGRNAGLLDRQRGCMHRRASGFDDPCLPSHRPDHH